MLEYRVETCFERTMADVFAALVSELGEGRWSAADDAVARTALPRAGLRFGYRQARRFYSGEVLECLRPVTIVLVERYCGPAVSILARQRWRVDPLESATRLRGDITVETNRFARLQIRFWRAHFASRAQRTCSRVGLHLRPVPRIAYGISPADAAAAHNGATGQKNGKTSIVSAKTTSVSGRPSSR